MPVRVLRTESSTMVYEVEYDADAALLRVRLHRGGEAKRGYYEYSKVPEWIFDKLCEEEAGAQAQGRGHIKGKKPFSVGTFYSRYIRPTFPEIYVRGGRRSGDAESAAAPPTNSLAVDEDADNEVDEDDVLAGPTSRMLH